MFDLDEDDDEESVIVGDNFQLITRERIEEMRDEIGKTNIQHNPYNEVIKRADLFASEGLTPVIFYNLYVGGFVVTSEENRNGKLH